MGESMKVAFELQPCCGNRSGIGNYTYELAKRMQDGDGLEFHGNVFNFLGRNDNASSLAGISMPLREFKLLPYGAYRRIWNTVHIPYDHLFRGKSDLSVFFNYIVPPGVDGKVMTTVYDMTYLRFPETMNAKNLKRLQDGMKYSVERADRIITISEFSKQEIIELLGVPSENISVLPCAPSLTGHAADFEQCKEKFGITKPYLLYVGTIEPRKNLSRLIQAFAQLKRECGIQHQLVLAGGKGWANEEIYKAAESVEDVVFTGYISENEKYALYKNAAAFLFPSLYEGFGIPPLEAMFFGCPVVCAKAASLPEVVGDAAELVEPDDVLSIAEGIWRILSNEDHAKELVERGYDRIKKYTWDRSAQMLTEICKTVLR